MYATCQKCQKLQEASQQFLAGERFFFKTNLAASRKTLDHFCGGSLANPILIFAF